MPGTNIVMAQMPRENASVQRQNLTNYSNAANCKQIDEGNISKEILGNSRLNKSFTRGVNAFSKSINGINRPFSSNTNKMMNVEKNVQFADSENKNDVEIKRANATYYNSYSFAATNPLSKGISLSTVNKSADINTLKEEFANSEISREDIQAAKYGAIDRNAAKLEKIHWVSADLDTYYKKHGINLQNNNILAKVRTINSSGAVHDYNDTSNFVNYRM